MNDQEINAAVAEKVAGFKWISTGYDNDKPPRPRWLELIHPEQLPLGSCCGWQYFPHLKCPEPCNRRHNFVPDYLHDAEAVIALLEKTFCTFWWVPKDRAFTGRMLHKHDAGYDDFHTFGSIPLEDGAFCRAGCLALLQAHGADKKDVRHAKTSPPI